MLDSELFALMQCRNRYIKIMQNPRRKIEHRNIPWLLKELCSSHGFEGHVRILIPQCFRDANETIFDHGGNDGKVLEPCQAILSRNSNFSSF